MLSINYHGRIQPDWSNGFPKKKKKSKVKVKGPLAHFGQRTHTHSFTHLFKKCWVPIIYKVKVGMLTMSIKYDK